MKISACMIAKNEEENIAQCIGSYKNIVDEIIVVDTGSTDDTVQIAKSLGAKVYHFKWINDFAAAKNYALNKAKGDWIIFLDADEYFDENKSPSIPRLIKKHGKDNEIIACKMINIDAKTGENLADFVQARIFKNTGEIHYVNAIHERLSSKSKSIKAIYVEENELVIYHTGYSKDRIIAKSERNLEMLLKEIDKPDVDPSMCHFLSDTYLTLKQYENAIFYAKKFLEHKISMEGLNSKVYQNLISAMTESGYEWEEIYNVIEEAIKAFPDHPMFQLYLARSHHINKRYEEALGTYKKTITLQENYKGIEINFITGKIYEIEYPIAGIYEYKNEEAKALDYYISALKRKKDYLLALRGLLRLIKKMDAADVIVLLNELYDKDNQEELSLLVEELTKQRYGEVLAYYVNLMYKEFGHQDFSLVVMFLSNNMYSQAFKHFYEAYLLEYDNSYAKLAIVTAYLDKNLEYLAQMQNIVKPSFKRIIEILLSTDQDLVLYKEDLQDYLDILIELCLLGKEDDLYRHLDLRSNFIEDIGNLDTTTADILKDHRYYEKAIELYKKDLIKRDTEKNEIQYLHFKIAYCYYKIRGFHQVVYYFEKALQAGYIENDIKEFLQWTVEQAEEKETILAAQALIKEFNGLKSEKSA